MSTGGSGRIGAGPEANEGLRAADEAGARAAEGMAIAKAIGSMPEASSAPVQQLLHPPSPSFRFMVAPRAHRPKRRRPRDLPGEPRAGTARPGASGAPLPPVRTRHTPLACPAHRAGAPGRHGRLPRERSYDARVAKKNTKKAPAADASTARGARKQTARATGDEMWERIERIVEMASGNGYPTREQLAEEFAISERALANIIRTMKERWKIDIRSEVGPDGRQGYKVHDANFLRTKMTRPEAIASVLLTEAVLGTPLIGDRKAAQSGKDKLEGAIDADVLQQLERLKKRFAVRLLQEAKKPGEGFFSRVLDGIAENRVLLVSYEKPAEAAKRRRDDAAAGAGAAARAQRIETLEIEPWGIFFAKRSWYLVARKRSTGDLRQYKLARFRRMDLTDRTFEVERGWTVEKYAADMWESMKDGAGRRHTVRIEVAEAMAEVVSETQWHPSQVIERRRDGSMVLTATISGLDEVRSWVLGMGAGARVLEPKELREQVDAEIRKMAARLGA